MSPGKKLTTNAGAPVVDNHNIITAGPRTPALLRDVWFLERVANKTYHPWLVVQIQT